MVNKNQEEQLNIETYKSDEVKIIEEGGTGLVKTIIHEEEEKEAFNRKKLQQPIVNKVFLFFSILILFFSFFIIYFSYLKKKELSKIPENAIIMPQAQIIFVDQNEFLDITKLKKDQIGEKFNNLIAKTKIEDGEILGIYPVIEIEKSKDENKEKGLRNKKIGIRDFLKSIDSSILGEVKQRKFLEEDFLLGVLNKNEKKHVFILLKNNPKTNFFKGLRLWEDKMFNDLHEFFGIPLSAETKYLFARPFTDGIIENKNVRILTDDSNNIIFAYIFLSNNYILITPSKEVIKEIIFRLSI